MTILSPQQQRARFLKGVIFLLGLNLLFAILLLAWHPGEQPATDVGREYEPIEVIPTADEHPAIVEPEPPADTAMPTALPLEILPVTETPQAQVTAAQEVTPTLAPTPPVATTDGCTRPLYIVQPGDTLGQIAALCGVSVEELARLNNIEDIDRIGLGQPLEIPDVMP